MVTDGLAKNGPNIIPPVKEMPLPLKFVLSFLTGFSPMLWFSAALVFITWKPLGTPPTDVYSVRQIDYIPRY
jgi:hypothetical protein